MTDIATPNVTLHDAVAPSVPVNVAAVKWPGHWIIRAMRCFSTVEEVTRMVYPYVVACPVDELEWTHHRYQFPSYLVYGSGDLPGLGSPERGYQWPVPPNGCVYLFPFNGCEGADTYRGPARRLDT